MPWLYVRRILAKRWGCLPWDVDTAPDTEVDLELRIMAIEAECEKKD